MTGARAPRWLRGQPTDRGSAGLWLLAVSLVLLVMSLAVGLRAAAVAVRHRAETSADLAALAGAAAIGSEVAPCSAAERVALSNGTDLDGCRLVLAADGRSGDVTVSVGLTVTLPMGLGAQRVPAQARAERAPP